MGVKSSSNRVFTWFSNMSAVTGMLNWMGICITLIRFRAGMKVRFERRFFGGFGGGMLTAYLFFRHKVLARIYYHTRVGCSRMLRGIRSCEWWIFSVPVLGWRCRYWLFVLFCPFLPPLPPGVPDTLMCRLFPPWITCCAHLCLTARLWPYAIRHTTPYPRIQLDHYNHPLRWLVRVLEWELGPCLVYYELFPYAGVHYVRGGYFFFFLFLADYLVLSPTFFLFPLPPAIMLTFVRGSLYFGYKFTMKTKIVKGTPITSFFFFFSLLIYWLFFLISSQLRRWTLWHSSIWSGEIIFPASPALKKLFMNIQCDDISDARPFFLIPCFSLRHWCELF